MQRTPLDVVHVAIYALCFVAVALLARRRPAFGIAALVAVVPFDFHADVGPTTITLSKVALLAAFTGLVSRRTLGSAGALASPGAPGALAALGNPAARALLLAGAAVAVATALTIVHAAFRGPAIRETLKALDYLALFSIVVVAAREDPAEPPVRYAFAGSLVLVCVLALAQEFGGAPSGFWYHDHPIPRIAGPLEGPNQLAGYLGIALAVVAAYLLANARAPLERIAVAPLERIAIAPLERIAIALASATLVLTVSRAGVIGAIVALALIAAVTPGRPRIRKPMLRQAQHDNGETRHPESVPRHPEPAPRHPEPAPRHPEPVEGRAWKAWRTLVVLVACGAVAGVAVLAAWGFGATHSAAGVQLLDHFSTVAETPHPGAVGTRSQLWHAAIVLWRSSPIFGIGAGNFEFELGRAGYPDLHTHANSLYLQALAEGGVVLGAATLALVATSIVRFARGPFTEPQIVAALGASAGFAVHQLFDLLVFYPKVGELWWIVLALGAARLDGSSRHAELVEARDDAHRDDATRLT